MPLKQLMNSSKTLLAGNLNNHVTSNREVYLDLAKFFAMIMMVAGHSFFEFASPSTYDLKVFPWDWWNFFRGKTAPTFLFLSGAVHVFANFKNSPNPISNDVFRRRVIMALILLAIGYILNSPINTFSDIFNINPDRILTFYQVNILHIFGIGLFILAVIYRFARDEKSVLKWNVILGIAVLIISPFLSFEQIDFLPKFIANYFTYKNGSIFILTPYLSYIFFGTVFGILLRNEIKNNHDSRLSRRIGFKMSVIGLSFILLGTLSIKTFHFFGYNLDLRADAGVVLRNIGIILVLISFARQIKIHNFTVINLISKLSKRAIFIYLIHLFIIYGIGNIPGMKHYFGKMYNPIDAFALSFVVIVISILITLALDKSLNYKFIKLIYLAIFIVYSIVFLLQ